MKHSITAKILAIIAAVLIISDISLLILGFYSVYTTIHNNYISYAKSSATIAADLLDGADIEKLQTDKAYAEHYRTTLDDLCKTNNLEYIYVYVPDTENKTITFVMLLCGESSNPSATDERSPGTVIKYELTASELSAMNGEDNNEITITKNEFGNVISCYSAVYDQNGNITALVGADVSIDETINSFIKRYSIMAAAIAVSFIFVLGFVAIILKIKVLKPAKIISKSMKNFVSDRHCGFKKLEIKGNDEFANMASSFNYMADEIDRYIKNINELTEEKHRREAEINIAKNIQSGLLPDRSFKNKVIEISAIMLPARDVGGDFYDYFALSDSKICTVIADVSGKGISAALFMSRAITIIRQYAQLGYSPSEILFNTNNSLKLNNPEQMFITVFVGIYDINTRLFTYANAGHNTPYIISDTIKKLDAVRGIAAGIFENEKYDEVSVTLNNGNTVFMYTDGVTEAVNSEKELFGVTRLENVLKKFGKEKSEDCIELVLNEVKSFSENNLQSDDITMLVFSACSNSEITIKAETKNLEVIKNLITDNQFIPDKLKNKLFLAAEEIFVNICFYAYDDNMGAVDFSIDVSNKIVMTFQDSGKKFNPLENKADIESYDVDSQIGGLGKFIAFSIADKATYEYKNNMNILKITKYLQEE